ncbi:MAG: hypothetical protein ACNI3A_11670 [Desulfovibrio sp.]|uniref:hypothetical protein n=1 Tax=Desulfovibrio sp. 7SRBS1 TaxID=3378064 RepID=UPI003B4147F0
MLLPIVWAWFSRGCEVDFPWLSHEFQRLGRFFFQAFFMGYRNMQWYQLDGVSGSLRDIVRLVAAWCGLRRLAKWSRMLRFGQPSRISAFPILRAAIDTAFLSMAWEKQLGTAFGHDRNWRVTDMFVNKSA